MNVENVRMIKMSMNVITLVISISIPTMKPPKKCEIVFITITKK